MVKNFHQATSVITTYNQYIYTSLWHIFHHHDIHNLLFRHFFSVFKHFDIHKCGDVAQLLRASDCHTADAGSIPWCGKDSLPRVNFSCRLSFSVCTLPCAITCINICAHYKDPAVHVRVRWIMATQTYSACSMSDKINLMSKVAQAQLACCCSMDYPHSINCHHHHHHNQTCLMQP